MYAMLLSNYGGHMAYTTDPPLCMAYPLEFVKKDNLGMTFWNPDNHPVAFIANVMVIHQLLMQDCPEHEYMRMIHGGCLIIPWGMQFGHKLFPEIVILRNHAAPYPDPTTGQKAPFMTVGPFSTTDPLFPGVARDWKLYTTQEVMCLKGTGVLTLLHFGDAKYGSR